MEVVELPQTRNFLWQRNTTQNIIASKPCQRTLQCLVTAAVENAKYFHLRQSGIAHLLFYYPFYAKNKGNNKKERGKQMHKFTFALEEELDKHLTMIMMTKRIMLWKPNVYLGSKTVVNVEKLLMISVGV